MKLLAVLLALLPLFCACSRMVDFMSGPYGSISPYSVCYRNGVYHLYSPDGRELGTYWDKPTAWSAANAMLYGDRENKEAIEADQ